MKIGLSTFLFECVYPATDIVSVPTSVQLYLSECLWTLYPEAETNLRAPKSFVLSWEFLQKLVWGITFWAIFVHCTAIQCWKLCFAM